MPDHGVCFKRFFEVRPDVLIADDHTPVLFLTAKSTPDDVVTGFELGANDYLKKPFAIQELIVRFKALMGKAYMTERQEPEQNEYPLGDYRFTPLHRSLFRLSQWRLLENPLGNGPLVTQLFAPYPSPFHRNTKCRLMR
jgi:YesN/AraC family two-component response regulator